MATGGGNSGALRVAVIDGQPVLRSGIASLLTREHDLTLVAEGSTGREAVGIARTHKPDVVLLGEQLADRPTGEVCRTLHRELPSTAVLIFSAVDDDRARFDAVIAGASGYLTKHAPPAEIVAAIRRAGAGESLFDPDTASELLARLSRQAPKTDPRLQRLKPAEMRILQLVSRGHTNRQIATRVNLSERTVKKYVSSILAKLAVSSRAGAAAYLAERSGGPASGVVGPLPALSEVVRSLPQVAEKIGTAELAELTSALEEQQHIHAEFRVQSEQLLADRDGIAAERQRFADLFESAPAAYVVTDALGLILAANQRAAALLGLGPERLAHRVLADFVEPSSRGEFRRRVSNLDGIDHAEWRVTVDTKDGLIPVVAQVSSLRDDDGKVTELRWILSPAPSPAPA
jgi:PAS domain S-box-containing protein